MQGTTSSYNFASSVSTLTSEEIYAIRAMSGDVATKMYALALEHL